jgi:hypothetical protein
VIEFEADCIRVKARAWTGSHFEAARTWAFERRKQKSAPEDRSASSI